MKLENKKQLRNDILSTIVIIQIAFALFLIALNISISKRGQLTVDTYTYVSQSEYDRINKKTYDEVSMDGVILMTQDELENIANEWEKEKK